MLHGFGFFATPLASAQNDIGREMDSDYKAGFKKHEQGHKKKKDLSPNLTNPLFMTAVSGSLAPLRQGRRGLGLASPLSS